MIKKIYRLRPGWVGRSRKYIKTHSTLLLGFIFSNTGVYLLAVNIY